MHLWVSSRILQLTHNETGIQYSDHMSGAILDVLEYLDVLAGHPSKGMDKLLSLSLSWEG